MSFSFAVNSLVMDFNVYNRTGSPQGDQILLQASTHLRTFLLCKVLLMPDLRKQSIHEYKQKHTDTNIKHSFVRSYSVQYCLC